MLRAACAALAGTLLVAAVACARRGPPAPDASPSVALPEVALTPPPGASPDIPSPLALALAFALAPAFALASGCRRGRRATRRRSPADARPAGGLGSGLRCPCR